ncbi:MAG: thioredoxin family protein [Fibromonadales bacterium]|nr:thioredoxin family protein [Fibromonadales bacterium]
MLILLLFLAIGAGAQSISLNNMEPPETELFYSKAMDTLYFKVTIPQDWHINANEVLDDFLCPSSIETVAKGVKFDSILWPEPYKQYNEVLNLNLLLLQGTFTVKLPVKSINGDPYDVKLNFTYQACSNICLAPRTMEVSFNNKITEKKNSDLNANIFLYILFAFLGGLILNVMPCVLPVVFLKIFDIMRKSGESARDTLKWGVATSAGIFSTFFAIAIAIFVIRLMGNVVGWGFQFQYPVYTATMALGIAIFALSLFGVFEIWLHGDVHNALEKQAKKKGAFAGGILLVLLSTPCSAPFLGTAVGFAFVTSTVELFLIFASISAGMSFPYLILSAFPQWTNKLPKPGNWMIITKKLLGIPLMLTVVWLVWVFSQQTGSEALLKLGVLLSLALFFAFLSGKIANPGNPWWRFGLLWAVFVAVYILLWNVWVVSAPVAHSVNDDGWISFSKPRLDSLQSEGYAVWVNGTADWCITCKMNDKAAFESEKVKEAFDRIPVIKMRANYTNPNNEALKFFESYGRSGVPFDLMLTAHKEAILLSEILTADAVVDALERAY